MLKKTTVFLMFISCIFLSSCVTWQPVKTLPGLNANNEIVIKPELQSLISGSKQNIKIVLRVPDAPKNITQETQKDLNKAYDRFERELSKVGFIIRDRELLEKIVSEIKPASYLELAKAIDTDLILEILYVGPCDFSNKVYYDVKTGHAFELLNPSQEIKQPGSLAFTMRGGQLDCRVITVRDGTVSGMFTLFNLPCDGLCDFEVYDNKLWRNPEPNPDQIKGWGVGPDDQNFHQLANLLMQSLNNGDIVVSRIQQTSSAAHYGLAVNDIIEKINGQVMYNLSQALDTIIKTDGKITLLIKREDKEISISFTKKFAEKIGIELAFKPKVHAAQPEQLVVTEVKPAAAPAPAITPAASPVPAAQPQPKQDKPKSKQIKKSINNQN